MIFLPDVSTLIALLWRKHVHHDLVIAWSKGKSLAICPITELGFLRVSTCKGFNVSMPDARQVLDDFLKKEKPQFIACDRSALEGDVAPGSAKTTDWYLANLASRHGMQWTTLDQAANHPAAVLIV